MLVHGAAHQVKRYAEMLKLNASDLDGLGITDTETLQVAITAANRVTHEILEGLLANDLRAACPNAVVAHPKGILGGVDHLLTGRVERIDVGFLQTLLENTSSRSSRRSAATASATHIASIPMPWPWKWPRHSAPSS